MNEFTLMRLVALIILTFIFTLNFCSQYDEENEDSWLPGKAQKYRPYFYSMHLPLFLLVVLVMDFIFYGAKHAAHAFFSACFSSFISIGVYYVILICLLPILRRYLSARTLSFLWLVPNFLYVILLYLDELEKPIYILHVPGNWIWLVCGIWFLGFASVMTWKLLSHLHYRRNILRDARVVTDLEIIELWRNERYKTRIPNAPDEILISNKISTPMTLGIVKGQMKLLLPNQAYSLEDLTMIFRHELVHIGRQDTLSKLFLTFCTAMCWFNPLMWIATKKCAEDIELSCDETVLISADDAAKKHYAELILKTAGDERGFTTCLSVKAKALQYRLKNITHPRKRFSGMVIAGVICFTVMFTCGHIALAYGDTTGENIIFENDDINDYQISEFLDLTRVDMENKQVLCTNEKELLHYLGTLPISEITGDYYFGEEDYKVLIALESENKFVDIKLSNEVLQVYVSEVLTYPDYEEYTYYLPNGVDWDRIESCLSDYPLLEITVNPTKADRSTCRPALQSIHELNAAQTVVFPTDVPAVTKSKPPYTAYFAFSEQVVSDFYIDVEKLDGSDEYTMTPSKSYGTIVGFPVDPAYYPAKFTVHATFEKYEAEYVFVIE